MHTSLSEATRENIPPSCCLTWVSWFWYSEYLSHSPLGAALQWEIHYTCSSPSPFHMLGLSWVFKKTYWLSFYLICTHSPTPSPIPLTSTGLRLNTKKCSALIIMNRMNFLHKIFSISSAYTHTHTAITVPARHVHFPPVFCLNVWRYYSCSHRVWLQVSWKPHPSMAMS